jgi:hypothetical protein
MEGRHRPQDHEKEKSEADCLSSLFHKISLLKLLTTFQARLPLKSTQASGLLQRHRRLCTRAVSLGLDPELPTGVWFLQIVPIPTLR